MRLALILLILPFFTWAQDSTGFRKKTFLPVPAFGYSPETKTYIGAVLMVNLIREDSLTRSSNAKFEVNYTWRKQFISEFQWNHFTYREKWFTNGILHFSRYPDKYFGIGASTLDSSEINFQSDRYRIESSLLRNFGHQLFIGGSIRYLNYTRFRENSDTNFVYNELHPTSTYGIQLIASIDRRDDILTPTKGFYVGFKNDHNYSNSYYSRISIDVRKYFSWKGKIDQIISARLFTNHVHGQAPFYDMSILGGDPYLRGYFYGRFRDNHMTLLQAEYRTRLYWRLGLSAFGGVGILYNDFQLKDQSFKPNAGLGLRFIVDKDAGTNLRFDYAVGKDGQSGFYVSFGESF